MSEPSHRPPKQPHFGVLLLLSFALFNLSPILDQTFRWSNPILGFRNGLVHVMILGIGWCLWLLPWSLLVFGLYRWRKKTRFRTFWILAPAAFALIATVVGLFVSPATPTVRFKKHAKAELPKNIQNLHWNFTGGGITDYTDTYYFQTTPEEVDRLIAELNLSRDTAYGFEGNYFTSVTKLPDCPDFSAWKNAQQFKCLNDSWFYYLITDSTRTQVYIEISCI